MSKIKIGITIGDVNGISPEIIIKALANSKMLDACTPIVYGSSKVLAYYKNIVKNVNFSFNNAKSAQRVDNRSVNVINVMQEETIIEIGRATQSSGTLAFKALEQATADAKEGLIDAIVTTPIHKHAMKMAGFDKVGHTEYLTEAFGKSQSLMLMVSDEMRVGTLTNHIPVSKVADAINTELIVKKIKIFHQSLRKDFGVVKPMIAVLGLNPHAGDEGLIGDEEEKIIRPAIITAKKNDGMLIAGPYPADGFFGSSKFSKVDGILSMYHDQGLIPFKCMSGNNGVNFTAGLPIVRTSPDHGTAYDIAGKNEADAGSLRSAIYKAIDIVQTRKQFTNDHKNPLKTKEKREEDMNAKAEKIVDEI